MERLAGAFSVVVAASLVLTARSAAAQGGLIEGTRTILDTNFSTITTTTIDQSGNATTSTSTNVYPQLTVNTDALIWPTLRLNAGGVFDVNLLAFSGNGGAVNTAISRVRPFFELRSTNQAFSPGIGYYRREDRTQIGGLPEVRLVSEDYAGYLGWKPEGGPQSDIQFVRTNQFDANRTTEDLTKDFGSIVSRLVFKGVNANYFGSYLGTTDRFHGFESRDLSNAVRLDQSRTYFEKRLNWNTTYSINREDLRTAATGTAGDVAVPVIAFAGLSGLSDTPVTAALAQNPLLTDANLTASAGINLGLTTGVGPDSAARNIGLDLSSPTEVSRLLIWIDRDLTADVAASFSWDLYSSVDNVTWTRETTVPSASFGPFETRFQLDFRSITARYLKAVTRPLSPAIPDATRFPNIFVTEIQAFVTRPATDARATLARTNHILNTDVRLRLASTPTLFYEGSYWYTGQLRSIDHRDILSNGVAIYHTFNPFVSLQGRGAYEHGTEALGPRVATVQNATLTITPIRTFTGSLLYTGLNEQIGGHPNDRQSFFLQSNTQLYRGLDVQFGGGWTFTTQENGRSSRDGLLNLSASIVPRPNISLTVNYADTTTRPTGPFAGDQQYRTRRGYVTLLLDPTRTLHLVIAEELIAFTGENTRTTHNIGANWAPFPDGSLQFIFAYNEVLRPIEFGTERIFRPGVRWTFSRQSYIDVSYERLRTELASVRTESKVFSIALKFFL